MNTLLEFSWQQKIITQWLIFICPGHWTVPSGISVQNPGSKLATTSDNVLNINIFLLRLLAFPPSARSRKRLKKAFNLDLCPARLCDRLKANTGPRGLRKLWYLPSSEALTRCLPPIAYRTIKLPSVGLTDWSSDTNGSWGHKSTQGK